MTIARRTLVATALLALGTLHASSLPAHAASAAEISRSSRTALDELYRRSPVARTLGESAVGVLVFPGITKGGFIFGAEYGNGTLFRRGRIAGYYNTTGISWGFQAGIQKYGYALFFMRESALRYLEETKGFELGAGPSLTVVDKGFATKMSTNTVRSDIYAFVFSEKGLMGGIGLQGTKITRIHPD